jgi:hypothetical protein
MPASSVTLVGDNFFALGPCEATLFFLYPDQERINACNITSATSVVFTLPASLPAPARSATVMLDFLPIGKGGVATACCIGDVSQHQPLIPVNKLSLQACMLRLFRTLARVSTSSGRS